MLKLFDNADSDSDVDIKTNNEYANKYNDWRKKEVLYRLKTKYGEQGQDAGDESSSSEDDDEIELNETFEKDFFKTLSCLKNKDPKIYDEKVVFFDEFDNQDNNKQKKNKKPLYLKDYERKVLLEKGAKIEDSDEEEFEEDPRSISPTYVEEQRKLKESLKQALNDDDNDEENWGGMFSKRQKTSDEHSQEEEDYKKWLKGNKEQLDNKDEELALKPLKEYWNKPDLENSEKFLRDYFLNKRYLEKEDGNHIPTYEEIVHDSDEGLSEDEEHIEEQEEFEHKFNFRYEEPDQEFIKRYPRTVEHSLRKTDDRRKVKRVEIKERKEEEKKQKQEDLKQLKVLKRQEIEEKIKKLKEITGNNEIGFQDNDIDEDFDPEQHDRRMHELFNDDYYQAEEGDLKPEFSDLEEELGPWSKGNEVHCEDEDFNMDCDYDPKAAKLKKEKKNKKKRNRTEKTEKDIELGDLPVEQNDKYAEYMDELYKLDCEDMIGDLPCRFKYRDVVANDFGLSIEEILLAKDRDLNKWCSLKKTMQYRPEHMEKYDVITYRRKGFDEELKRKILPSIFDQNLEEQQNYQNAGQNYPQTSNEEDNIEESPEKSNEISKTMQDAKAINDNIQKELEENYMEIEDVSTEKSKKGKRKRKCKNLEENSEIEIKNDNQIFTGVNDIEDLTTQKSKKNKGKRRNKTVETKCEIIDGANIEQQILTEQNDIGNEDLTPQKSKRKLKNKNVEEKSAIIDKGIEVKMEDSTNKIKPPTRRHKKNLKLKGKSKPGKEATEDPKKGNNTKKRNMSNQMTKDKSTENKEKQPAENTKKRKFSEAGVNEQTNDSPKKKRKLNKKVKKDLTENDVNMSISKARLEAYGINPKKYKNKLKYKNKDGKSKK